MRFINKGESVQVRGIDSMGKYKWTLLKKGEIIELPKEVGLRHGFEKVTNRIQKVTKGKIGKKKVETKQFEDSHTLDDLFFKELIKIKGIAKKTAEDIMKIYSKESLIKAILNKEKLPLRDDIEQKLRRKYGK